MAFNGFDNEIARLVILQRIELATPLLVKIRKLFGRYLFTNFFTKFLLPKNTINHQYYNRMLKEYNSLNLVVGGLGINKTTVSLTNDYIFLCFFLGNDFMPHFPSMCIRTNGIDILENAYKHLFGNTNKNLCNGTKIYWENLREFIEFLAKHEYDNLLKEYKIREKWGKRQYKNNTMEEKMMKWLNIPTKMRDKELLIDPYSKGWEKRYYKELFYIDINQYYKKQICVNYLEGLEWTMKYYTTGCKDTKWFYKYNYPPLLSDLLKYIPMWDINLIDSSNVDFLTPEEQLAYVLPKDSLHLLPKKIRERQLKEHGDYYNANHEICWAFCKYFWESHVLFSHY